MTNIECFKQVNMIADKVLGAMDTNICDMEELDRQIIAAYLFGIPLIITHICVKQN